MKRLKAVRGFTLLELLVAVVITLLLAGIMLSVTTGTLTLWRRTQDDFTTHTQARLALDLLERDLQSAVHRHEDSGTVWLAAEVINAPGALVNHGWRLTSFMKPAGPSSQQLLPDPLMGFAPTIAAARFGLSGVWLRLITTNVESEGSLPVAVSYQLVRRPVSGNGAAATNPADIRYSLFRSAVSSEHLFVAGNDVTGPAYGSGSAVSGQARTASTIANPHLSDLLATNVVDFGLWLYVRETDGSLRRIFPATNADLTHAGIDLTVPDDGSRFPEVADIMIRVLTDEGARVLDAMEHSNGAVSRPAIHATDADWWWSVVEEHSRVFTRQVEIKGGRP